MSDSTEPKYGGSSLIALERNRQITAEGWTREHDDEHDKGELREAAIAYLILEPEWWPWEDGWKPSDEPIRNLVKAGALIAAEIDRLQRAARPIEDVTTDVV